MRLCTRILEFDAGHRVLGHENKCKFLHGHRYKAEVTVRGPDLDNLGRVVDFGVIKNLIGGWIDWHWDHNLILHPDDPLATLYQQWINECDIENPAESAVLGHQIFCNRDPYIMPAGTNPTAENLAQELLEHAAKILPEHLHVLEVKLWETPNCYSVYHNPLL